MSARRGRIDLRITFKRTIHINFKVICSQTVGDKIERSKGKKPRIRAKVLKFNFVSRGFLI